MTGGAGGTGGATGGSGDGPIDVEDPHNRTILSWSRTNAALITAALLLARFGYTLGSLAASILASLALVVLGVGTVLVTLRRRVEPILVPAVLLLLSAAGAGLLCLAGALVAIGV